jgi:hypothetical protein
MIQGQRHILGSGIKSKEYSHLMIGFLIHPKNKEARKLWYSNSVEMQFEHEKSEKQNGTCFFFADLLADVATSRLIFDVRSRRLRRSTRRRRVLEL